MMKKKTVQRKTTGKAPVRRKTTAPARRRKRRLSGSKNLGKNVVAEVKDNAVYSAGVAGGHFLNRIIGEKAGLSELVTLGVSTVVSAMLPAKMKTVKKIAKGIAIGSGAEVAVKAVDSVTGLNGYSAMSGYSAISGFESGAGDGSLDMSPPEVDGSEFDEIEDLADF